MRKYYTWLSCNRKPWEEDRMVAYEKIQLQKAQTDLKFHIHVIFQ